MAEVQKGSYAVVWGANVGVAYIASGVTVAASDGMLQNFTMTQLAEETTIKDQVGNTGTMVFFDQGKEVSIEVIPIGTNIADANNNGVVPTAGTLVALSLLGTTHDQLTEDQSGKYIARPGAQLTGNNANEARISMTLYQNTATDLSATIAAS
jgi:hypothetical protein